MPEILTHSFMQHAFLAALLISIVCGLTGTLVVLNRMVFLSGGIAHAAYGGVGLATYTGWAVLPSVLGFSVLATGLMGLATLKRKRRTETLIGVLWALGMATGIILVDLTPGYSADLMSVLFGSLLAVSTTDLVFMGGLVAVVVGTVLFFFRPLAAMAFDSEFAESRGLPVRFLHFLLLFLVPLTVVMSIRLVGLILVIALLSMPPALAQRHTRSIAGMMAGSIFWALLFCTGGLFLSWYTDITSGAAIIATGGLVFLMAEAIGPLVEKKQNA